MMPIYRLGGLLLTVMIAGCAVAPPAPAPVSPAVEERPPRGRRCRARALAE
jgi:hypothetical protein